MTFRIKRAYEPATTRDGMRVLVDRLWPRGVSKVNAHVALWMKDVAPSTELRRWFDHEPDRLAEFSRRYKKELTGNAALKELRKLGRGNHVTLVYAARDPLVNHACVLLQVLRRRLQAGSPAASRGVAKTSKNRNVRAAGDR
jgi:uncharacterized protein YeaO (DUF488 family)